MLVLRHKAIRQKLFRLWVKLGVVVDGNCKFFVG